MTAGRKRKTFVVPDEQKRLRDRGPIFSWGVSAPAEGSYVPELRDTSKPIAFDEHGGPLYAPRGIHFMLW